MLLVVFRDKENLLKRRTWNGSVLFVFKLMIVLFCRFEENNMIRIFRKRKSHDTGRNNRQELDNLAEFSELRSITKSVRRNDNNYKL